ncbi:alpha/beta fold hydrolase, partial [Actinosynnema sp. NPDC059335]|uniref:alpha/beta fold hydrolase n=1 Tax=Actinosynnema sp. NPDC059335 TaxID=3346804 RepID=UPI0036719CE3
MREKLRTPLRAAALDFRGHGSAPPLAPDADWGVFADDVIAAAGALAPGPVTGVGHSLGGTALLLAEARAPGTFERIVCYEPILATTHDPAFAEAAARRRAVFPSRAEALARYSTRPPLSLLAPDVLLDYVDSGLADEPGGGVRRAALRPVPGGARPRPPRPPGPARRRRRRARRAVRRERGTVRLTVLSGRLGAGGAPPPPTPPPPGGAPR